MDRINAFNVTDNLVEMYVFHIRYRNKSKKTNRIRTFSMESTPFNYREVCSGAMYFEISDLKARGFEVTSYYVEKIMVPDVEQQF